MPRHRPLLVAALCVTASRTASAQGDPHRLHHASGQRDSLSVMGTVLTTHSTPAVNGRSRTEALLTQPMLMARGSRRNGTMRYAVMLNAEHWTMRNGEPVAGIWGEGFVDRRHPHTVVHEVMLTAIGGVAGRPVSLSAGRGIVPFGTDDPMVRPFTKYPANHHHAQILERLVISGAVRLAPQASLEVALFNGDEPMSSLAAPRWSRFGDSRAGRLTLWPSRTVELQGSLASVRSPEFATGAGFDQRKWSSSARWTPEARMLRYLLAEWARTEDRYASRSVAGYGSGLVEAQLVHRGITVGIRAEQTSRHEEERLLDPFRTARPPSDLTVKGITRWRLLTAQVAAPLPAWRASHGTLFLEATHATSAPQLRPVLLDPADVIGADRAWHVTAGIRLGLGTMPVRVGRYGAAAGGDASNAPLTMRHR